MPLTYKESGVDIEKADSLVENFKKIAKGTILPGLISGIGPFASSFRINLEKYPDPVIVASCDGVGTKILVAKMAGNYNFIGQDLVAMNVNDVLCSFGEPVLFYDYIATGKIREDVLITVVKSISKSCRMAGCILAGGETAEMPGLYADEDLDLAGFAIGIVSKKTLDRIDPPEEGDLIIGFPSSGFHSNGYSFLRKLFFEKLSLKVSDFFPGEKVTIGEVLLKPTKIYVKIALGLMRENCSSGFAHITGGGIFSNTKRAVPEGLLPEIDKESWKVPRIFKTVQNLSEASDEEMFRTFNMGIGFVCIVKKNKLSRAEKFLRRMREKFYIIGEVRKKN